MIRVLHVVTYMGRGGLETMLMNYYRNINRNEIQFDFLVHRDFKADYDDEILALGGQIYHVPVLNPFSREYHKALDAFFQQHHYDIVHSHLDCLSAYPLAYAKKYGVQIRIAHAHNKQQDRNLKYLIKIISKQFMPYYATNLFACSKEAGAWMFGKNKSFYVLNNAINAREFSYDPEKAVDNKRKLKVENKFVIGHVGRFFPQKNHEFLIRVFKEVLRLNTNAVLLLVGIGEDMPKIKYLVNKLEISDKVKFLGSRNDIPDILQACDVFVFPSLYEGLGIAAVEAQAAGLPCVLSDGVPNECKMTESVVFLSLDSSIEKWAKCILSYENYIKKNTYNEINKSGYDIDNNSKKLSRFYLNKGKSCLRQE